MRIFMSVDTPFLEPKTGLALLSELGDADICTLEGKASYLETATAAYSKIALQPSENVSCSTSSRSIRCGKMQHQIRD